MSDCRRIGRVKVNATLLRAAHENMRLLQSVMLIGQTDYDIATDSVTFTGTSRFFDEVAVGDIPPNYHFIVDQRGLRFI